MLKSLTVSVLVGLAALIGWSARPVAQTAQDVAPVPGPYSAAQVTQIASAAPAPRAATAIRSTARPMHQMMPYWMRPSQPPAGQMPPWMTPGQQQYIVGWVWSPRTPTVQQQQNRPSPKAFRDNRPPPPGFRINPQPPKTFRKNRDFPFALRGPYVPKYKPKKHWRQPRSVPPGYRDQFRNQNFRPNTPYGATQQYGTRQQYWPQNRPQYQTPSN